MNFKRVTLEMSLKPFYDVSEEGITEVLEHLYMQWRPLVKDCAEVSIMFWTADGSEILDYSGNMEEEIEWGRYIGTANSQGVVPTDPTGNEIHSRCYIYRDNPPIITYEILKRIVELSKSIGKNILQTKISVGATFDPGPEFAKSSFKYERHNEICMGGTMGHGTFLCCYAVLNGDDHKYAGFPNGIPDQISFGAFLGRQTKHFSKDLGFDYLWLSNGLGFGLETWGLTGAVFDGNAFSSDKCIDVRDKNLGFWNDFRAECPDLKLEVRGTNLSTGMDLSSDAVPWREIYNGGFDMLPPPNSPWAALNYDFGLELTGWMSHIAELPAEDYLFRYYIHDPWWKNSPWLDRYGREAYDIYLPLSISRINAKGETKLPTNLNFLSADDSFGECPDKVPNEVIPHILRGREFCPTAPGVLVWLYPFDEYHDYTYDGSRIDEVFFGDWFIRGAVNNGLPLNTVVSTKSFLLNMKNNQSLYGESILITTLPDAGSQLDTVLIDFIESGGKVLFYGPIRNAGEELLSMLNLKKDISLDGEMQLELMDDDNFLNDKPIYSLDHYPLLNGGGICAGILNNHNCDCKVIANLKKGDESRIGALTVRAKDWNGGVAAYVRGTISCDNNRLDTVLLIPLKSQDSYPTEALMRHALSSFGLNIKYDLYSAESKRIICAVSRHDNAFVFSGFSPDTTVGMKLRMPQGIPILQEQETIVEDGCARLSMPKTWHHECRIFVEQDNNSVVSSKEGTSEIMELHRRIWVRGLNDATVRFYPPLDFVDDVRVLLNPTWPYTMHEKEEVLGKLAKLPTGGCYYEYKNVTGEISITY